MPGFLFTYLLFLPFYTFGDLYLSDVITDLFISESIVMDKSDNSCLGRFYSNISYRYSNVLRSTTEKNDKEIGSADLFISNLSSDIGILKGPIGITVDYKFNKSSLDVLSDQYVGNFGEDNYLNKILASFHIWGKDVYFQISGGKAISECFPDEEIENALEYNQPLTTGLKSNQIVLGSYFKFNRKPFLFSVHLSAEPVFVENPEMGNINSEELKKFPFFLYRNSIGYEIGLKWKNVEILNSGDINKYSTDSISIEQGSLPFYSNLICYNNMITCKFKSIECLFSFDKLNFDIYGLSDYLKYLKFPEGELKRFKYLIGYNFNKSVKLKIIAENINGILPKGDLDFTPFSVWSIFYPKAYRFENSDFKFLDAGVYFEASKKWNNFNTTDLEFKGSFSQIELKTIRSEKKIYVLIPVYVDDTNLDLIDKYGFTGYLSLKHSLTLQKNKIGIGMSQWLPIWKNRNDIENSIGDSSISKKVFGGTQFMIDYSFKF